MGRRHRGRRDRRRRGAPRRYQPRASGGPRGAGRHRERDLVALVAADPRRPALPGAVPVRAGPRGARRAGTAAPAGAAPGQARAVPVPAPWPARRDARVLRLGAAAVRPAGLGAVGRAASSPAATKALEYAPALRREGLRGGLVYHDGDGGRRPGTRWRSLRTALDRRARPPSRGSRATGPLHDGRPIVGMPRPRGPQRGAELDVRRRACSTRPASGRADPDGRSARAVRPCAVARQPLLVAARAAPGRRGLTLRVPGKVVFIVPWPRHWSSGRRTRRIAGRSTARRPSGDEVDELIDTVNRAMDVDLSRDDVVGTYAGLRPLVAPSRTRVDRQGLARAPGRASTRTVSSASAAASTRPTG